MIVREHINFKRGIDPKEAMGIGMTDEHIIETAEKILKDAFPFLDVKFKEDMNNSHSYYALLSGNPKLLTDLQLIYNSKKSSFEPGFCLFDSDGGDIYVPDKLYEIQPIISAMHNYISKYGWWQDEKKYINDEYIK